MKTNETPFNDQSENTTGCCPRFNDKGWDGQILRFKDKPFVRATTHAVAHLPIDMGKVFSRVLGKIDAGHAVDPSHMIVMSRDLSAFKGEHLFAVDTAISGEENIRISGDYLTKVFEGPYKNAPLWEKEMNAFVKSQGKQTKKTYFFYTTCPKCAKFYGKNYVVGVSEIQ